MDDTIRVAAQPVGWSITVQLLLGAIIAGLIYAYVSKQRPYAGIPIVDLNGDGKGDKFQYMFKANDVLDKGQQMTTSAFQIRAAAGYKIVLPRRFAEELRGSDDLNFGMAFAEDFHASYPGFESMKAGLRPDGLFADVVRVKLTQSLGLVTDDIIEEANFCTPLWFGSPTEWTTFDIKTAVLDIVARLSTRVFAGKDLARNEKYLRIAQENTVLTFQTAQKLHEWPAFIRRIVHAFLPDSRNLKKQMDDARTLLKPAIDEAKHRFLETQAAGKTQAAKSSDALTWMLEMQKGRYLEYDDIVGGQLSLSLAAIHTTTEMTTRALLQICDDPELVQPLREEMVEVLRNDGWAKTTLYKMKLLDSFLKEVQRVHKLATTSFSRYALKQITLSDGTVIPKGALILIRDDGTDDPSVYAEPEKFDAYRHLHLRETDNAHQFVTTSANNMGFGHGKHACPGRFFASNEIKILFAFMLLKYDWRYEPGHKRPDFQSFESQIVVPSDTKLQAKERTPEIDLMNPQGN